MDNKKLFEEIMAYLKKNVVTKSDLTVSNTILADSLTNSLSSSLAALIHEEIAKLARMTANGFDEAAHNLKATEDRLSNKITQLSNRTEALEDHAEKVNLILKLA